MGGVKWSGGRRSRGVAGGWRAPRPLHLLLHARASLSSESKEGKGSREVERIGGTAKGVTSAAGENPSTLGGPIADVEMVCGKDVVWTAQPPTVVVLWDLDNKPPCGPPFTAASALHDVTSLLGHIVSVSAFANHHAFSHVPAWVANERRERRAMDRAERSSITAPPVPYSCSACGRRFPTCPDLTRHKVRGRRAPSPPFQPPTPASPPRLSLRVLAGGRVLARRRRHGGMPGWVVGVKGEAVA